MVDEALTAAQVAAEVEGQPEGVSIIGFGSLLSEDSARLTCPGLTNFRLGRVRGWRRVFAHPAAIFFERGIARPESKEIASLSTERGRDDAAGHDSFVVCAFDVPATDVHPLLIREEEFNFVRVPFWELGASRDAEPTGHGWMCTRSTDEEVLDRRGHREKYRRYLEPAFGFTSVWGQEWGPASGLLPCPVYCRHCLLASERDGVPLEARESFLDDTLLADRTTTLRQWLSGGGAHVRDTRPPDALAARYSG